MSDNKNKRGHPDSDLISLNQKYEVQSWCKKWDISTKILSEAVKAVGHSAKKVEQWLIDTGEIHLDTDL